jgi:hypothetical protein
MSGGKPTTRITPFTHPATTLGKKQLDILTKSCQAQEIIHKQGFEWLKNYCKLNDMPQALASVDIGAHGSGQGHAEFTGDAMRIHALALCYVATKDNKYAELALKIQDAWNITCKEFKGSNAPLEIAWGATCIVRGCELLKYNYAGWKIEFEQRLNQFIDKICLPNLINRYNEIKRWNNNWILTIQEALLQIALFRNDTVEFQRVINEFKTSLPCCVSSPEGMCTETKRDLIHTQFQIGSMIQIAEMAWHQGFDIYQTANNCIQKCMEYHANILNGNLPSNFKKEDIQQVWFMPSAWEVGYNHFSNRLKISMPQTDKLLKTKNNRPEKNSFNWGPSWMFYSSS